MGKIKRNLFISYSAGILFSIGWWILIDANAITNYWKLSDGAINGIHYLPAIAGTFSLILLNAVSASAMDFSGDNPFIGSDNVGPKITIFIAFILAFGSLFGATYIFADKYMIHTPQPPQDLIDASPDGQSGQLMVKYPGIAVLIQNILIFAW